MNHLLNKKIAQSFMFFSFILLICVSAFAQSDWAGKYDFAEDGGKTAGGTAVYISHQLDVSETDDGLIARLSSAGYQTSIDLNCTAKVQGNKLLVYFESYGEDNMFEKYAQGDLLFTLEKKTVKGKTQLLTYWSKFTPSIDPKAKNGKVYFQKMKEENN